MHAFAPFDGAVGAAATVLSVLAATLTPLAGGSATALAIVVLTIAVRLAVSPLSYLRVRGQRRQQALQPQLRELQDRLRDDPQRRHAETVALYRSAGVNPLGGCLPGLLQAPFFLVMYWLAVNPPAGSALSTGSLFGVPLLHRVADGLAGAALPVFAGLVVLLAVLAWRLSRQLRRTAGGTTAPAGLTRLMPLLPYGTVLVAGLVPLAAGLYLVTSTAWTVLEQAVFGPGRQRPRRP